ncbi:MAG: SpoIIE family protein phosphatase [Rhodocyclaceae bacterium]|nr:SpoIIE family protein phosphatase [Rhodocyclaceae bacterium]
MDTHLALKILVADDTLVNRSLLSSFLTKEGHRVILAQDGQEAVEVFEREQPDLVFMDVIMPKMDGLEATRRIKESCGSRWVPVIIVSSLEKPEQLAEGLESGADDYLLKPLNFRILQAKMRSMMRTLILQHRVVGTLRRSQAITDHMLDVLITMDDKGIVRSCNPATQRLFGFTEQELVGQNVKLLMPEPIRSLHDGFLARYRETGIRTTIGDTREVLGQKKDGSVFPIQIGVSELMLDGQRTFIGILRDISDRLAAERRLLENAERLQRYHDAAEEENSLAREIMAKQLHRPGLDDPQIKYGVEAAANFSGDLAAARRSPQGRLYAMLADATGHGLAAAISALPAIPVFYGMAGRNLPLALMITEMNTTLRQTMPSGRFVAVAMICVDEAAGVLEVWNGGMPDMLWLNEAGDLVQRFGSRQLPLGILPSDVMDVRPQKFRWHGAGQLVICSDGVLEAENRQGIPFGMERLLETLRHAPTGGRYPAIREALSLHMDGGEAQDDASIMVLDCIAEPAHAAVHA